MKASSFFFFSHLSREVGSSVSLGVCSPDVLPSFQPPNSNDDKEMKLPNFLYLTGSQVSNVVTESPLSISHTLWPHDNKEVEDKEKL